jgi:hypothetical protein
MQTLMVKLNVRDRGAYLSAISADVPGLHIVGPTPEAIRETAMKAVKTLLKANRKMEVLEVLPTDDLSVLKVKAV